MTPVQVTGLAQRERALQAITALVAANGYSHTTVAQIARDARISRAKFYEHFDDKQDCFIAAAAPLAERLSSAVEHAIAEAPCSEAAQTTIATLLTFAEREPPAFYLPTQEAVLAGPRGWQIRDRLTERLGDAIQAAWTQAGDDATVPDIPPRMLVGGALRLIGVHMRRGEREHADLLAGLLAWLRLYLVPNAARRSTALRSRFAPSVAEPLLAAGLAAPQPLPKGRHRLPADTVARIQRERLLLASAEVVCAKGHVNVSVDAIVRRAGVSREVFYAHFRNREQALLAGQALCFEQLMGVCTGAFFNSTMNWPERIWEACDALTRFIAGSPALAGMSFVESYALGPEGMRRADDSVNVFSTIFLEEGRQQRPQARSVSALVCQASFTTVVETIVHHLRHGPADELPGLQPLVVYVCLAPFIGVQTTNDLIDGHLG